MPEKTPPKVFLYILNGSDEGKCVVLKPGKYILGRSAGCDIVLGDDLYVSGTHAELTYHDDSAITISDTNSSNGTYVLGEPTGKNEPVNPGDIIRLGRTFLKLSRRSEERIFGKETTGTPEAIVVVDIVGSSKIAQAMGDGVASKVKNFLFNRLNANLKKTPAEFMKNTGDGFMLIFSNAVDSVRFARNLMIDINEDGTFRGIHLRVGIHYGETFTSPDGDRRGIAVDMAFRIEAVRLDDMHQTQLGIKKEDLPRADRIFISEVVQQLIPSHSSIKTRCIGYFDLKNFTGRHKIFEVLY